MKPWVWFAALSIAGTTGCSDGGLAGVFGDDDGGGTADGEGADTGNAPGADDEGGTGDGAGADETGTGGADPSDGGDGEDASCDFDCGEGGACELDEDGAAYCSCADGHAAYGMRCLPCTPTDGNVEVDIPMTTLRAEFLLNGTPFPDAVYEHGEITLRVPGTGERIRLGDTRGVSGTDEDVAVLPGEYDVYYTRVQGGDFAPANEDARVGHVSIPDEDFYSLVIDVTAIDISGTFLMNGETAPDAVYENGEVYLRNRATGDEVQLGETRDQNFNLVVVPGHYDVHYRNLQNIDLAPLNANARVGEIIVSEFDNDFEIAIEGTELSGAITINGEAPPDAIYENGQISLRDYDTHDEIILGETRNGSFAQTVAPGQYEVVYRRLLGGDFVPVNTNAVLQTVTVGGDSMTLDVEIPTAVVAGTITVGGGPAPSDPTNDGAIILRKPETGDAVLLGNTREGAYSQHVIRDSYEVYYRQETSSGQIPINTNARIQPIEVTGPANFDIDIPMVNVSADITLNGEVPPESSYDDGLLYLRDKGTGDSVLLGSTRIEDIDRPVVPGAYELVYVVEAAGPTVPVNAEAELGNVDVSLDPALSVDIPVVDFGGGVRVDGEPPPSGLYNQADLVLLDASTLDTIYLGRLTGGSFDQQLTDGTYILTYRGQTSSGAIPRNADTALGCYQLTSK
ncbi:MAG: hypothetical protein AAF799_38305 [Myxococcota bacterium]